jgi:4-aminobutyrate aminotransferase-like enzyme
MIPSSRSPRIASTRLSTSPVTDFGSLLPELRVAPPGSRSRALAERLRAVESRNVTWLHEDFPVFWTDAAGANVRDVDGNVFLDLTAAFGVALAGHRSIPVAEALRSQAARLVHGMGDVHPADVKVELLERLAALLPWSGPRILLASSGSEAIEAALKTALMGTGRPGILAFAGGYHGLTLGSLAATARPYFRDPFTARLYAGAAHAPFPCADDVDRALAEVRRLLREGTPSGDPIGAVVIEPVQARGGVRVLDAEAGRELTRLCRASGALLVADEVFTGLGRCGAVLASPLVGLEPDLVCLGKVLGGGLPLSACAGPAHVMDAWPESTGEALHTSTFLGHPLACATALAVLGQVEAGLPDEAEALGLRMRRGLEHALADRHDEAAVRGLGLLLGVEPLDASGAPIPGAGARAAVAALGRGVLVLPAGDAGTVLALTPPVTLNDAQLALAVTTVAELVARTAGVQA